MKKLYPLKFKPILKSRVWGGTALVGRFGKELPADGEADGTRIGESWEVSAIDGDCSEVANGFLAENDLQDILETYLGELVGDRLFEWYNLHFPLLVKILDIRDFLSLQVHPDDETAFERYDSFGKTEFWYVMESSPDAKVYMGFKRDTDASEFYDACRKGTAQDLLNVYHPEKGDCFFIKAGTVHAAGGGLVIAEVQESSDITFRLYDWCRELDPATRREMHLDEAIDCIDYTRYDENSCYRKGAAGSGTLAECSQFIVNGLELSGSIEVRPEDERSFTIYICTSGSAILREEGRTWPLKCGESVLVPASCDEFLLSPVETGTYLLEVRMPLPPEEGEDDDYTRK